MFWVQHSAQLWHYPTFLMVPLMMIAWLECFVGWRAWRFLLGVNGAIIGFIAGAAICCLLNVPLFALFGGLAGGIAGAFLFCCVVPVGSFVLGAGTGVSFTLLAGRISGMSSGVLLILACAVGVAVSIPALGGRKGIIIGLTAISGAQQMASAWRAYFMAPGFVPAPDTIAGSELTAFVVLASCGMLIQFVSTRKAAVQEAAQMTASHL